jgi:hypothetical protein
MEHLGTAPPLSLSDSREKAVREDKQILIQSQLAFIRCGIDRVPSFPPLP